MVTANPSEIKHNEFETLEFEAKLYNVFRVQ